jgi:hypothetical protein
MTEPTLKEKIESAGLQKHIRALEDLGCIHMERSLGFAKMPEGYALMLNADRTHYFWLRHDGGESDVHWNKWAVRKGAIANARSLTALKDKDHV